MKRSSKAASDLAKMRPKVQHKCAVCERSFKAIQTAVYCSNACRQRAKYQRQKSK